MRPELNIDFNITQLGRCCAYYQFYNWKKVLPYYMKFWRHFNLANLAIFQKIAKLKCTKIKCR